MKILVTGTTGFIGSAFCQCAEQRGFQIGALVRTPLANVPQFHSSPDRVLFHGSLAEPPWSEIEKFEPDLCVHSAWITSPGYLESAENERLCEDSFAFIKGLVQRGLRHLVVLGTCIEYQTGPQPLNEATTPLRPTTPYAKAKHALHLKLSELLQTASVPFAWARVFYPYGVGERPERLCTSLIQKLRRGEKVLLSHPESVKDWIYIDDLAAAMLAVVEKRATGAINLGTGRGTTVGEMAQAIGSIMDKAPFIECAEHAQSDPFDCVVADVTRLTTLGWRPQWTVQAGLERLIKHLSAP